MKLARTYHPVMNFLDAQLRTTFEIAYNNDTKHISSKQSHNMYKEYKFCTMRPIKKRWTASE